MTENEKLRFLLERLARAEELPMLWALEENTETIWQKEKAGPLDCSRELRILLMEKADCQQVPCLYCDETGNYFLCVKSERGYLMAGPMGTYPLSRSQLHDYRKIYELDSQADAPEMFVFQKILELTRLVTMLVQGKSWEEDELITENGIILDEKDTRQQLAMRRIEEEQEEIYHHTYMEERKLLECVEQGDEEEAVKLSYVMDTSVGRLSKDKKNNIKNLAIAAVTLCTRAAIAGGVSPSEAYRLSDHYIMRVDEARDIVQIFLYRDQAVRALAHQVRVCRERTKVTNYVEQCKDYVNKNYRKKIYVEEIAEQIGISSSYLSHMFHKETGKRLQDYVVEVRIERAKNLLMYSEESLADIAAYVNFPSQSYFGEKFRKYTGVTPMQFRNLHKPAEFHKKENI